MEIIRILSNNKGFSLVLLVIVMAMVGLLGAGMVSFMGMKHRTYPIQAQSYQAFNIANAGVEFAIRYANDNINKTTWDHCGPPTDFICDPAPYIPCYTSSTFVTTCTSPYPGWKTVNFGGGQFQLSYDVDANVLHSQGTAGSARREVTLNNFSAYFSSGGLALVPGALNQPHQVSGDNKDVHIPLLNNTGVLLYVFGIEIGMPAATGGDYIQEISYRREPKYGGDGQVYQVYDYNRDTSNPYYKKNNGIEVPDLPATATMTFNISPYYYLFPSSGVTTDTLDFKSASRRDRYYVILHYSRNPDFSDPQLSILPFKVETRM